MMCIKDKRRYLNKLRERYQQASKGEKSIILDEFCTNWHHNRKYAIRLFSQPPTPPYRRKGAGRKPVYHSPELLKALKKIWFTTDQMCSKRLIAAIPLWLPHYERHFGKLPDKENALLLRISASTIDRLLKPTKARIKAHGKSTTKPGTLLRNQIPIRTDFWDITQPGFVEADTVAHCGNSLAGDFVWSLTMTDYCTGWTECRATWNKGSEGVLKQIQSIEKTLPFPLLGFDCDNGSEFLNYHLLRYFQKRKQVVHLTRSRPYKKNDNAHVEQKNWTHVRQLFGYDRFENPALVTLMNHLYANEWSLFQNYFCPTMKLKEKHRVNSKYKCQYEKPTTPYHRAMACETVS